MHLVAARGLTGTPGTDTCVSVTEADVRSVLSDVVKTTGGTAAFAAAHKLSQTYVQMAMRNDRTLGPKILSALNIRKNVNYEWIAR